LVLVGLPPKDLLEDVALAWKQAGFDVDECFRRAVSVTNEWTYTSGTGVPVAERIAPKWISERTIPPKLRSLEECLNPQPLAASVMHKLLDWIDRVDSASQLGLLSPPFQTREGDDIFPDEPWWLTDVQRKEGPEGEKEPPRGDEDGAASSENAADLEDAPLDNALTEDEDPLSDADGAADRTDTQEPRSNLDCGKLLYRKSASEDQSNGTRGNLPLAHVPPVLRKRKRETMEVDSPPAADSLSPASQELSPFMRACGSNQDASLAREDK
jgi:hypothetical protein